MSGTFHKSCYTFRSSGYKYRTFSTNTGEKKLKYCEDNAVDKKFDEIRLVMTSKIDNEVNKIIEARAFILEKYNKIDAKVNSMIALQETVLGLRNDLRQVEYILAGLVDTVNKIEMSEAGEDLLQCLSLRSQPILEEREILDTNKSDSIVTHV